MTQSNSHLHHRRTPSSNGSKVRTSRPTLHRKGTYSVNHPISKLGSGQVRRPEPESDRQPDMAASFLNFWYVIARYLLLIEERWESTSVPETLPIGPSGPYHCCPSLHTLDIRADQLGSAMCERQITVPDNSLLYCSERCAYPLPLISAFV